ncbi:hypothetical protein INR49_010305 [Caranx melampygus]|nr:hypothetical protein INR49_010305 [Caranx melampygus]
MFPPPVRPELLLLLKKTPGPPARPWPDRSAVVLARPGALSRFGRMSSGEQRRPSTVRSAGQQQQLRSRLRQLSTTAGTHPVRSEEQTAAGLSSRWREMSDRRITQFITTFIQQQDSDREHKSELCQDHRRTGGHGVSITVSMEMPSPAMSRSAV